MDSMVWSYCIWYGDSVGIHVLGNIAELVMNL